MDAHQPLEADDELQFQTAEPSFSPFDPRFTNAPDTTQSRPCGLCKKPIESTYFALRGVALCPSCTAQLQAPVQGSPFFRLCKATLFGLGAGLVGAVIWYVVRVVFSLQVGIVAIVVGYMTGKAVWRGSNGKGGVGYQILAVVLTYCCICANILPDLITGLLDARQKHNQQVLAAANANNPNVVANENPKGNNDAAGAKPKRSVPSFIAWPIIIFVAFIISLAYPFLGLPQSFIGLLIISFALWEAWKFNARRVLPITGPFQVGRAITG